MFEYVGKKSTTVIPDAQAGDPVVVVDGATLNSVISNSMGADAKRWMLANYKTESFVSTEMYVKLIRRTDGTSAVAIPGGMVDPGESGLKAAIREFVEEAANGLGTFITGVTEDELKSAIPQIMHVIGDSDSLVYQGLVDDNRNTDDAWMETQAFLIDLSDKWLVDRHLGSPVGKMSPQDLVQKAAILGKAGDDAAASHWVSLSEAERGIVTWHTPKTMLKKAGEKLRPWLRDKAPALNETETFTCCYASHRAIIQLAFQKDKS